MLPPTMSTDRASGSLAIWGDQCDESHRSLEDLDCLGMLLTTSAIHGPRMEKVSKNVNFFVFERCTAARCLRAVQGLDQISQWAHAQRRRLRFR